MRVTINKLERSTIAHFPEFDNHQTVLRFDAPSCGLLGFIAIHRARGELSTGGTRFTQYQNESDALRDALRLSSAMTAKCIISGLPYGGAKGVIMATTHGSQNRNEILTAYAEVVASLDGAFRTGEDVGMTEADVQFLLTHSNYFNGKSGIAGDPSPFAAKSVALVMERIARVHLDHALADLHVAVRGVGKVGGALVKILTHHGGKLSIADKDPDAVMRAKKCSPNANEISAEEIAFLPSDIYAPCAFGNEVNKDTLTHFQTKIICGGANNQLADKNLGKALTLRNILYVPDYLANAGGLINVSDELEEGGYRALRVEDRISSLPTIAENLYHSSRISGRTLAEEVDAYVQSHE